MNGMTSQRVPREPAQVNAMQMPVRSNIEPMRARTIQIPDRSNTVASNALGQLGLRHRHIAEEQDDHIVADFYTSPRRKRSQKEQDDADEEARKRAMMNLVNSWQERLQLISLITTFFASIEAGMLVPLNTDPNAENASPGLFKAANAGLLGALVMHVYAAVLSFLAAFLLIRYKLKEATKEEYFVEGNGREFTFVASPENGSLRRDPEIGGTPRLDAQVIELEDIPQTRAAEDRQRMPSLQEPPIFSKNPHLEQVGFWSPNISSHLLSRVHGLCITLAAIGFALAIMGIMLYTWALQTTEVSIFATACLGAALLAMTGVLFIPDHWSWKQLNAYTHTKR